MTPQPQKKYIITEMELQKISWNFTNRKLLDVIRSRPAPASLTIDPTKCFDDLVYSSAPWKIYRQDAGMGEHDYAVMLNDVFFCRTEHSQTAHEIIRAVRFAANMANAEEREATIRNQTLDAIIEFTKGNSETIEADDGTLEDAVFLGELLAKIESLRPEVPE